VIFANVHIFVGVVKIDREDWTEELWYNIIGLIIESGIVIDVYQSLWVSIQH
jgi:hypothetical protein